MRTRSASRAAFTAHGSHASAARRGAGALALVAGLVSLALAAAAQQLEVRSLSVAPEAPVLATGQSIQLSALGSTGGEGTQDLTDRVSWSSANEAVATVDATGRVTAVGPGVVTITASLGEVSGSTEVTVPGLRPPDDLLTPAAGGGGPNEIVAENQLPGTPPSVWDVQGAGHPSIQGFATEISVNRGETVRFKIDTPATDYRIDIYRLGWYGGNGARKVATIQPSVPLPQNQPNCLSDPNTGLIDCGNWAESASWAVPANAVSGVYIAHLVREDPEDGRSSHIPFIVRNDGGASDILLQVSDATWHAYNAYGGNSLYTGSPAGRAFAVSYNRPITTRCCDFPDGESYSYLFSAEYPMIRWLERNGYNVSYFTDVDADRRGAEMLEHAVYMIAGHDEYWSARQRANVEAARDAGVHIMVLSGNTAFWKTRWEPDLAGRPHRTLVCYKETHEDAKIDPEPGVWTGTWRDSRFGPHDGGRPENALLGTIFMVNGIRNDPIRVPEADGKLRFWRNTSIANLAPGQVATLPSGVLGYEWDEDLDNGHRPPGLVRLSTTVVNGVVKLVDEGTVYAPGTATHHLTLYRAPSGALVFSSGSVQWSWGMDAEHDNPGTPADPRMQQATVNLLADMGVQPATLQPGLVAATASTDAAPPQAVITSPANGATVLAGVAITITGTASDVGGRVGAVEVSTDGGETWHPASGRESWSYEWTPEDSGPATLLARAADDSANLGAPSAPVEVTVSVEPPLAITVTPNSAVVPFGGSQQFVATGTYGGGVNQDLTNQVEWSSSNANVATVNATGLATAVGAGGTTIRASLGTVSGSATLTVLPAGALIVTTSSLPGAEHAQPYSASLSASGGSPPYTWSLASGSLPPGVSLSSSGVLSGTPSATGVWSFTVRVSDGGQTATRGLGLSVVPAVVAPDEGPGGPILVVTDPGDPFGRYYNEILRAEGLNAFASVDLADVTPALLADYAVVLLAPQSLSGSQVSMLTSFVQNGGTLIAMRPHSSLGSLLGLSPAGGTVSNGYLLIDPAAAPGLVDETIQFHGTADRWNLAGASMVARLYTSATSATSHPAVTHRSVGSNGGRAIAFTYDLARSVVFTRQGNPAWLGQDRDGLPPRRSNDLFFGPSASDPQPDWIDFGKIHIPQADEQQRLLANLILEASRVPLPRFWYFPSDHKAVVVLTADEHSCCAGTQARFAAELAASPPGCSVDDWECVRSSSYVYPWEGLNDAQALAYHQQGFELGVHVSTGCGNYTPSSIAETLDHELAAFASLFPSLPQQVSSRTHCIVWSDWASQARAEAERGIRLDTNYYYWPASWVADRPGFFTGSGLPMRFADLDGTLIDAYQATTQFTDESGQSYPQTVDALLDRALGPEGYYGAFVANLHNDIDNDDAFLWASLTVASAQARGVPLISGRQLLTWIDGRTGSSFQDLEWNGSTLTFDLLQAPGARNLRAMLPMTSSAGPLTGLRRNGSPIAFDVRTIKGIEYAVFDGVSGSYEAIYVPDDDPPVISNLAATPTHSTATITWTTDELASSTVHYGTSPSNLNLSQSTAGLTATHEVVLTNLAPQTTYFVRVVSTDRSSNSSTFPQPPAAPFSFTTNVGPPPGPLAITTSALPTGVPGTPYTFGLTATGGTPPYEWSIVSGSLPQGVTLDPNSGLISGTPAAAGVHNPTVRVRAGFQNAFKTLRLTVGTPFFTAWTTQAPTTFAESEPSVELGVKFRTDIPGFVTGVRFYKHPNNTGTHVGNLWSSSGQLLASAVFTNETASGWQQVQFSPPVPIQANTTYIASYFSPNGFYAFSSGFFATQGVDNGPVHLLSSPAAGGNGVFQYGPTSAFPTNTFNASNYWVDVVFSGSATPLGSSACFDEVDEDGDGFDGYPDDPGCSSLTDTSERSPDLPCDDGIDNDGDGMRDFANPPGSGIAPDVACRAPDSPSETTQCQDGVDNDGDGKMDFDGGESIHGACSGAPGGCPPGVSDPNGDGVPDPDPQCVAMPYHDREDAVRCGLGAEAAFLLPIWWALRRRRRGGRS
jgi:hypothetical protein